MDAVDARALAALPRVDDVVAALTDPVSRYGRGPVTAAVRAAMEQARTSVRTGGEVPTVADVAAAAVADLTRSFPGPPRRVLNAAGVVVHTNLGRAPLSSAALRAVSEAAGHCDLEYDLPTGARGSRGARLSGPLTAATGAEAGIAVNNAAAALVLVVSTLAAGRQVVVSRGELVEIGGSFRLPDILSAAGAHLLEVGTTNRTRASDYEAGDDVGLILKVHPSNYRISGFVAAPSVSELADVAHRRGVALVHDVGSGLLGPERMAALAGEPDVATSLRQGADLVVCSGDKLLGGPQAGLLVGRADLVTACAAAPLARALRLDKLRLAALVSTLETHLRGARNELPVWGAITASEEDLARRCDALAGAVGGTVTMATTMIGGGSAPGEGVRGPVVVIRVADPDAVAGALRRGDPPVILRVADDSMVADVRTVDPADDDLLAQRIVAVLRQ